MARIQGDMAGAYVREAIMLCKVNNKNKIYNLFIYLFIYLSTRYMLVRCRGAYFLLTHM
jgi:hypothetical protein